MSNEKFTPAPWFSYIDEENSQIVICQENITMEDEDRTICRIGEVGNQEEDPTETANANLIAAAPDMYEAIRQLVNFIEENKIHVGADGSLNEDLDWLKGKAKAALSKANPKPISDKIK